MTIKYHTTGYIKQANTVTYELYSLQNYTDANTISLYDRKIVVKEYEIVAAIAACKMNSSLQLLKLFKYISNYE